MSALTRCMSDRIIMSYQLIVFMGSLLKRFHQRKLLFAVDLFYITRRFLWCLLIYAVVLWLVVLNNYYPSLKGYLVHDSKDSLPHVTYICVPHFFVLTAICIELSTHLPVNDFYWVLPRRDVAFWFAALVVHVVVVHVAVAVVFAVKRMSL